MFHMFGIYAMYVPTIVHKVSETNSSFHAHSRKGLMSSFQEFSSSIDKTFILAGGLGTRLSLFEV